MNPSESGYCSGCGFALGLEPPECPSETSCPGCAVLLNRIDAAPGFILDCPTCGGQFVPHAVLRSLVERAPAGVAHMGKLPPPANPLNAPVVYRSCPMCRELMHRKNFGQRSGIVVDICTPHGTWFDLEELPLVLAFIEAGGLRMAPSVSAQRPIAPAAPLPVPLSSGGWGTVDVIDFSGAIIELIRALARALKP